MRLPLFLWLLPIIVAAVTPAHAEDPRPTLKQAQAAFEKADRELNETWAVVKKKLGEAEFNALKEEQRSWLGYRDNIASSSLVTGVSPNGDDRSAAKKVPEYYQAAAEMSQDRSAWLRGLIADSRDDSLTGEWSDSYGGNLQIVEQAGKLYFGIAVVRGPTAHEGGLDGIASWNAPIGWYSDKGLVKDKPEETNLAFHLENRRLQIVGANTSYYHGARAYFDGHYVRIKSLDEKARAEVIKAAKEGQAPEAK